MTRSKLPSFLLATWLLGTIATKSRMSDFLQSLQEYEIVYPRVIPNESAWNRRSTHEDRETWREYLHQEPVFLEISNWTLRTMANDRLILSSNFTVNWVRQGKTKSERRNAKANCDLRQGSLEEDASSFVVVTICEEEVYALMLIGQRSFFVQPLTNGQHVMFQPKNEKWWSIRNNSSFVSVNPENPAVTSSLFSKSTSYIAQARHLPNVIGNLVFLHSFQLAVVFYVLQSGSIIYLCEIPACTLPSTMINCGLGFHYLHYSTSIVALTLV
ncbi:uncharacterized protein LOC105667080 isoform X4 [Bombus terrestris]|uniref:Uncharacterized protein LOC105667080 isoform X4 n=1 Tax=Bombus terrestris TaxID=30195 RepID=A0A9C6VYE2_BOMTE|nr:uncharacterized protein LOC105667080 isoform X4 [Bombus terrestris]